MRRRWSSHLFIDRCWLVRESLDNPAITTDIIVGFPGETEADFQTTCRVSRDCGFSKIHIFPFSPRKGTPAAQMTDQVSAGVKNDRCERLAQLERQLRHDYFQSLIGRRLTVLIEGQDDNNRGAWLGTACRYAPVEVEAGEGKPGALVAVKARAVVGDSVQSTA
jgi:threonylcarbamoyladenosine tRNA methylthiotransferase MtaB